MSKKTCVAMFFWMISLNIRFSFGVFSKLE